MHSTQPKDLPDQMVAAASKLASAGAAVPDTRNSDHSASSAVVPEEVVQEAAEEAQSPEERTSAGPKTAQHEDSRRFVRYSTVAHGDCRTCCGVVRKAGRRTSALVEERLVPAGSQAVLQNSSV